MEFRQLEYFCTISELKNFTRTAEALHVSQPSVTKAIKALEAELGFKLIDRSQKHVNLTAEGRAFLLHAKRIMQDMAMALKDMERFSGNARGTIHFGIPPMVEAYLFPDLFTKFQQAFPDIILDVQEYSDSEEVIKKADLGELDFGIVLGGSHYPAANELLIMKDNMSACLPIGHPLTRKNELRFKDLMLEKFIIQQPHTFQYKEIFQRSSEAGFVPEVRLCTSQIKTIKQLVANGMGVSVLPDFVTGHDDNIVRRPLMPAVSVWVSLYWTNGKSLSVVDNQFRDFIRDYIDSTDFKKCFNQG